MNRYLAFGIVAVLLLVGGWWYLNQSSAPTISETTQLPAVQETTSIPTQAMSEPAATVTQTTSPTASTANWKTYRNDQYNFELKYPPTAQFSERKGDTYVEVVFEDGEKFKLTFFSGERGVDGPIDFDRHESKPFVVASRSTEESLFYYESTSDVVLQIRTLRGYDNFYSRLKTSDIDLLVPTIESVAATLKYTD